MSDYIIQITEPNSYSLDINTDSEHNTNLTVEVSGNNVVDVLNNQIVFAKDLPEGYPFSWLGGTLSANRVSGLPVTNLTNGNYITIESSGSIFNISATGLQPSGNYSIVGHSHIISDVSGLQSVLDLKQSSGNYSVVGHHHNSADIDDFLFAASGASPVQSVAGRIGDIVLSKTDVGLDNVDNTSDLDKPISFAMQSGLNLKSNVGHNHIALDINDFDNAVSGVLPKATGLGYVNTSFINNTYQISVIGLQPSGNYSDDSHTHGNLSNSGSIGNASGLLVVTTHDGLLTTSYGVSSNLIKDFHTSVSGLLPTVSGSGYVIADFINNQYVLSTSGLQPSGNYADLIHSHGNLSNSGTIGTTSGLLVVTTNDGLLTTSYGVGSNLIKDFNNSVSGLLPGITGVSGVLVSSSGNNYLIGLSNPSIQLNNINDLTDNARTFLLSPSSFNLKDLVNDETGSGLLVFNSSPNFSGIPTVPTALSGTNNTQIANTSFVRTEISNLVNSAPSALDTLNELATALGNDPNFATTVTNSLSQKANLSGASFSGAVSAPTGNFTTLKQNGTMVSVSGHKHIANDITDFNSSVSGLLPVTNVVGGTNISVTSSGSTYTVNVSGQLGLTAEEVDDRVANLLVSGSGISLNYNDPNNLLTISTTGLQPSGNYSVVGHSHLSNDISDFNNAVSGIITSGVNTSLTAGTGISLDYFSNTDTLMISTSGVSLVGHHHVASEINDFNDTAKLIKLNDFAVPTGYLNLNTQRIINVATAVSGTDAINKNYVDTLLATTGTKGIASFDNSDFNVTSGIVTIKNSGVDNNQLAYSNIVLGLTTMNLGGTYLTLAGVTIDGGSP